MDVFYSRPWALIVPAPTKTGVNLALVVKMTYLRIIYINKIQCKSVCLSVCHSVCNTLETLFLELFAKFFFHLSEQALGSVLVKSEFKYLK